MDNFIAQLLRAIIKHLFILPAVGVFTHALLSQSFPLQSVELLYYGENVLLSTAQKALAAFPRFVKKLFTLRAS